MSEFELKKSAYSRYLGRGLYILLEFSHSSWLETYRFINNNKTITIDSNEYLGLPFKLLFNTQGENSGTSIGIANIDRQLTYKIREAVKSSYKNKNIQCKIYLAHIERDTSGNLISEKYDRGTFEVISLDIDKTQINLGINLILSIGYNIGTIRYNKNLFPNLYL
ncbi:MAG: hypothetical protein BV457_00180 [Thermoplasmata archaeon M9B1D]|nr:MAG: hypothetical protein BV457_00180 [Thermoplasmata archaeon M9B1D]PNX52218.1 MAG: hypothetical protein BV456_00115 [Thermoplasmata archaeon M8B2D]